MEEEKVYFGNYRQESKKKGGWFIGRFMDGLRNREDIEIKFWEFPPGKTDHEMKALRSATEITILLRGRIIGKIEDKKEKVLESIKLETGDYVIIPPKTVNRFPEIVLEYVEGLTIKIPSVENDKITGKNYEEIINKLNNQNLARS